MYKFSVAGYFRFMFTLFLRKQNDEHTYYKKHIEVIFYK